MSDYRVSLGHDIALGSLVPLTPQPRSTGVQATIRRYAGSGAIYEEGYYIELVWDMLPNAAAYQEVLQQFDLFVLTPTQTSEVTIYVPGPDFFYRRYNGIAIRPATGQDVRHTRFAVRDVIVLVRELEFLS